MTSPLALQLYSVRDAMADDFNGVLERIARTGYVGVELIYVLPGTTTEAAAKHIAGLGLQVCSAHVPAPIGADADRVLDFMNLFGARRIISGMGIDDFGSVDQVSRICDRYNEAYENARARGLAFGLHNHWMEYQPVDGRPAIDVMLERLDPGIFFELDTYWIKTAGQDPVDVVRRMGQRAPLLHIKDGPAQIEPPMVPLGQGVMDLPGLVDASAGNAEWLIVELDHCATDMLDAVDASYRYMISNGLAHGNRN